MKLLFATAALALGLAPALAQESHHVMFNADKVEWQEGPAVLPGTQMAVLYGDPSQEGIFVARVKFPANYRIPPHTHPVDEIVTVISGQFNIGVGEDFDEAQTTPLTAGGFFSMTSGSPIFSYMTGETVLQLSTSGPWGFDLVHPEDTPGPME